MRRQFAARTWGYLTIAVLSCACSIDTENCENVNQDTIYQDFLVTYDVADDDTTASAQFRFGGSTGTTLDMTGGCSVSHGGNGDGDISLSKDFFSDIVGTSFDGSTSGRVETNTFTFTNTEGTTFSNEITIDSGMTTTITSVTDPASKSGSMTVNFNPSLREDESITFTIALSGSTVVSSASVNEGDSSFEIESSSLSGFEGTGSATILITRYKTGTLSAATSEGGSIRSAYQTSTTSFTLND